MLQYSYEQLAIIISIPIITIFLVWTTAIFFKNRRKWAPYDIPIVSLFILSIIRNLTILSYVLVLTLNKHIFNMEYCSILVWVFNSTHTFQASNLSTLCVIGLLSTKLKRKQQTLKHYLNSSHVLYHLFCLVTLCACVGVAALLARNNLVADFENITTFTINPCKLMPFDLDLKYNVFIIVLHLFLASISFICFIAICFNVWSMKTRNFDYIKKSNSDISDASFSNNNTIGNDKNYYDTYIIHRSNHCHQNFYIGGNQNQVGCCQGREPGWNSDLSNLSTTVSSTNSRKPCLSKGLREGRPYRTGLETIVPIVIVCYLVYHVPVLVLCLCPKLIYPWPVAGAVLWLGLLQDILLPIGLGLVDSRFSEWVSDVYKCSGSRLDEKLPQVGLDGKFRPFGSQPQSLEIVQMAQERNLKVLQTVEHRFPITNGSLYTSIDGRLPVIHNYRRNKDQRGLKLDSSSNPSLHTSHLKRPDMPVFNCPNCETDQCPSHSNLHHLSPNYINQKLNALHQNNMTFQQPLRNTVSHESLTINNIEENPVYVSSATNCSILKNSRNLVRLNRMKLSKSEDSLSEIKRSVDGTSHCKKPLLTFSNDETKSKKLNEQILDYSSSDEDYDGNIVPNNFDTLSSRSSCSITTEANEDFHFYQSSQMMPNNEKKMRESINSHLEKFNNDLLLAKYSRCDTSLESFAPKSNNVPFLKRVHSKRSIENFQAFLEDRQQCEHQVMRSNSQMSLKDRNKKNNDRKLFRSSSKLSDCSHKNITKKIKSVEYLPNINACTWVEQNSKNAPRQSIRNAFHHAGSVPDLKKVFISEYI
ncbi:uncharacterized protein LOC123320109 [Coccinella septempunctata]|uniref:uncharacterized protein LOC123320109 n=1 Tax=Coccinella septempunctata TaxID=41139 RepID=UPI001D06602F|nr:uncharacterized protein LOC123320109 [Coccinella septempunctata]